MKFPANLWKQTGLMTLIILTGTSTTAFAAGGGISGNIAATSTYVWRGLPQTIDAALQGGLDYSTAEGIHAGVWTSNVAFGSEMDVTIGFAGAASGIDYDVGLIVYTYPQYEAAAGPNEDYNFNELYASISKDMLNARFSTSSEAGNYIEINANFEKVAAGMDLGLHFGSYDVDKDFTGLAYTGGEDYNDYNVSLGTNVSGFGFSFTLSDTNLTDDSYRTFITVSKDFTP